MLFWKSHNPLHENELWSCIFIANVKKCNLSSWHLLYHNDPWMVLAVTKFAILAIKSLSDWKIHQFVIRWIINVILMTNTVLILNSIFIHTVLEIWLALIGMLTGDFNVQLSWQWNCDNVLKEGNETDVVLQFISFLLGDITTCYFLHKGYHVNSLLLPYLTLVKEFSLTV